MKPSRHYKSTIKFAKSKYQSRKLIITVAMKIFIENGKEVKN